VCLKKIGWSFGLDPKIEKETIRIKRDRLGRRNASKTNLSYRTGWLCENCLVHKITFFGA
jgi:hypothetical protein